jgi:hypothetical protein
VLIGVVIGGLARGGAEALPSRSGVLNGPLGPEVTSLQGLKPRKFVLCRTAGLKPRPSTRVEYDRLLIQLSTRAHASFSAVKPRPAGMLMKLADFEVGTDISETTAWTLN